MADKIDDDAVTAAMFVALVENRRKNKRKRNRHVWVQPWVVNRPYHVAYYALIQELHSGDAKGYRNFLRMDADSFRLLLDRVSLIGILCLVTGNVKFASKSRIYMNIH